MISHAMADLMALPDEHDRMKARGFVERAGMVLCGGLPQSEMPRLNEAVLMSQAKENMLVDWSAPPSWDPQSGREAARAIFARRKSSAGRRSPRWPPMSAMGQPMRMSFLFTNSLAP